MSHEQKHKSSSTPQRNMPPPSFTTPPVRISINPFSSASARRRRNKKQVPSSDATNKDGVPREIRLVKSLPRPVTKKTLEETNDDDDVSDMGCSAVEPSHLSFSGVDTSAAATAAETTLTTVPASPPLLKRQIRNNFRDNNEVTSTNNIIQSCFVVPSSAVLQQQYDATRQTTISGNKNKNNEKETIQSCLVVPSSAVLQQQYDATRQTAISGNKNKNKNNEKEIIQSCFVVPSSAVLQQQYDATRQTAKSGDQNKSKIKNKNNNEKENTTATATATAANISTNNNKTPHKKKDPSKKKVLSPINSPRRLSSTTTTTTPAKKILKNKISPIKSSLKSTSSPSSYYYPQANNFLLHSSEYEPSPFQLDIPPREECLMHIKICALVATYTQHDANFDWMSLKGVSRKEILGELSLPPKDKKGAALGRGGGSHRPIISSYIDCGTDLVVEARIKGTHDVYGSVEAIVFRSEKWRQFVVCFRASDELQKKPVRKKKDNKKEMTIMTSLNNLNTASDKQQFLSNATLPSLYPPFLSLYSTPSFESQLFAHLNNLTSSNLFCDIVMTGHSFGATLATIAASRYAMLKPMMRVSCHGFGCPKVGGRDRWREMVHSLPNLKIVRIEYGADPYVNLPEGHDYAHVGHTITINPINDPTTTTTTTNNKNKSNNHSSQTSSHHSCANTTTTSTPSLTHASYDIQAYKFDRERPQIHSGFILSRRHIIKKDGGANSSTKNKKKDDHEVSSYVRAMEGIVHAAAASAVGDSKWVESFVGEEGTGISGMDDESRCVV